MNWIKILGISFVFLFMSCGTVKYGLGGSTIPPNVKTVSIKLFENKAALVNPLLAQVFTEKLKDKFINQTGLAVIKENGDWQFEGYISGYEVSPVNRQTIGGGTRNKLTISIFCKFKDIKNPDDKEKSEFEKTFIRFEDFESSVDFASKESELIDGLTDLLVQDAFNESALKW